MPSQRSGPGEPGERRFENEPADEWTAAYGRGGPVRSDEPERDYFFENSAAPQQPLPPNTEDRERMSWRAAGAQDYPGGALDDQIKASHRGKGPKGYRPSDERLRKRICERLTDDPFIDASDIEVSVANGEATLSGTVETRRMKFSVEELVADIAGVISVENAIRVRRTT